jgi:hypothetical protein
VPTAHFEEKAMNAPNSGLAIVKRKTQPPEKIPTDADLIASSAGEEVTDLSSFKNQRNQGYTIEYEVVRWLRLPPQAAHARVQPGAVVTEHMPPDEGRLPPELRSVVAPPVDSFVMEINVGPDNRLIAGERWPSTDLASPSEPGTHSQALG